MISPISPSSMDLDEGTKIVLEGLGCYNIKEVPMDKDVTATAADIKARIKLLAGARAAIMPLAKAKVNTATHYKKRLKPTVMQTCTTRNSNV